MKIAVEGCCHGELDKIYETLQFIENKEKVKVDLLLICGDFQAVRNRSDLQAMAVPPKYQLLNSFYKYYSGEKKAPVLTIVIGGNHEASNYLQELPYGGWIAPNIYYLGYAGVVNFGGVRIAGLSGIYKGRDYNKGHYEHPPYNDDTKRSVYHVRNLEVFRLKQLKKAIDIFISHDWPRGIYNFGNTAALLRRKKYFRDEVESGSLGNPAAEELLYALKPAHWFSAHLHCKFAAVVQHKATEGSSAKTTKFLALDKCLPNRSFLQVLDIEPSTPNCPKQLELDPEWLCVLKSTNHLLNLTRYPTYMPGLGSSERYDFAVTENEIKELSSDFGGLFKIPDNFAQTAEVYKPQPHLSKKQQNKSDPPQIHMNLQTSLLCEMLGLTDPFAVFSGKQAHTPADTQQLAPKLLTDDSDVGLDDEEDEGVKSDEETVPSFIDSTMDTTLETSQEGAFNVTNNPDEISLDDIDDIEEDKSQSDSNMDTSAHSAEGAGTASSGSGAEQEMNVSAGDASIGTETNTSGGNEMNISVTGGNINILSGSDANLNVSELVSSTGAPSPISRFGPQGASTPQPIRTKLVLNEPISTPVRKIDSMSETQRLGKRLSDEGAGSKDTDDSLNKTLDDSTTNPGPSKAKKFKRRNQSIYQDTSGDGE